MPIQAQSADGAIHEFPDGTADAIIDKAMKTYAAPAASSSGPQPTMMQTLGASPVGRFAHDFLLPMVETPARLLAKIDPTGGSVEPMAAKAENTYQGALSAQRNRPGYAEARQAADAQLAAGGGSGITDQFISTLTPTLAGLAGLPGGLNSSNAAADAQTTSQQGYATRNPALSTGANILGGFMATPKGGLPRPPSAPVKQIAPSIADLKDAAKASYNAVDNSGVRVSTDALNRLGDSVQDSFGVRLDPVLHPDATAAFNRITQYATDGAKGGHIASFQDLDNLRRVVADAASTTKPADKAVARMMLDKVDDFVDGLKATDLDTTLQDQLRAELTSATGAKGQIAKQIKSIEVNKPGALAARGAAGAQTRDLYTNLHGQLPQAEAARVAAKDAFTAESDLINAGPQATVDALNHAREMWSRASQASLIQKQIDKATIKAGQYSQSGMQNALTSQFRQLALNDRAMARLSPEVREAVKNVANGGPVSTVLRHLGKFAPHGVVSTALGAGTGFAAAGPAGAVGLPLLGEAARFGATRITKVAAQKALDTAALGRHMTIAPPAPAFQLPQLTPRSAIPYGLFGAGALTPSQ